MKKQNQIRIRNLSQFMMYILGRRPDEFGLIPDEEGYLKIKELLWAIHEEEGWRYVSKSHIREVLLSHERELFEADEKRIKTVERYWNLDLVHPCQDLPKLLFHPVRERAHPLVTEKGVSAPRGEYLLLTPDRETALRIGLRRDRKPVILEISVEQAQRAAVDFISFGNLFLAAEIPPGAILGPPLSREFGKVRKKEGGEESISVPDFRSGTFILDAERDPALWRKDKTKGKKQKGWKEAARKMRRKGKK